MIRSPRKVQAKKQQQTLRQLQDLQRLAAGVIMRPLDRLMRTQRTCSDGRPTAAVVEEFIKPNDRLASLDRIEIYNRQYWFRLIDCLYDDYPGLLAIVGQARFDKLLRAYLEKYPSTSFTLRNLGGRLEQFIVERPDLAGPKHELAREMAAFEWAQVVAFDGPEHPPLGVDDLLGKSPRKLRLALQPYITLMETHWPLDDYSLAIKAQMRSLRSEASNAVDAPPTADSIARVRPPRRQTVYVAVHRHDYDLFYKRLDLVAYRLLVALRDGKTLAAACDYAVRDADPAVDWAGQIQTWFSNWTQLGWFYKRR